MIKILCKLFGCDWRLMSYNDPIKVFCLRCRKFKHLTDEKGNKEEKDDSGGIDWLGLLVALILALSVVFPLLIGV
jgi:hypothetical protein